MLTDTQPGWIKARADVGAEQRRREAFKMKAYIDGFRSKDGVHYGPDARGKLAADLQLEQLMQQVSTAHTQTQIVSSYLNAKDLTNATSALIDGKAKDADTIIKLNPVLREQLRTHFNLNGVAPIDLEHDKEELQNLLPNVDVTKMTPEQRQALLKNFVKTINTDGSTSIVPTEAIVRETNYFNYLPPSEREKKKQE